MTPFPNKLYLSSPTMHGEELRYMQEAYETNWMSTIGANIDAIESELAAFIGRKRAVALSSGTAALHLAVKLAGVRPGDEVLCSDLTFAASVNPVAYEHATPVFVDSERETWNMDPKALERAFERHPNAKAVIAVHLYGTPAKMEEIVAIAHAHGAIVIEDAAESLGATLGGRQTGSFGDISCISFNGNKIITGSSGGMLLVDDDDLADKARKWSTQSREAAPWYQHEDLGYNYRMSNVIAGVVRGQLPHLQEHIAQKQAIAERYRKGLQDLPVVVAPSNGTLSPAATCNYWLACLLIDERAMCAQERTDTTYSYTAEPGKTCPQEILDALAAINAEGRPIWKPMHLQPFYRDAAFVSVDETSDIAADIFARGLCLPSDNKMTPDQQDVVIETIRRCFA